MKLAECALAEAGHLEVRLETDTLNNRSRAFYERRVYQEAAGRIPNEEWGSGLPTILLVKRL